MLRRIRIDWSEQIRCSPLETPFPPIERTLTEYTKIDLESFADFLDVIGLVGMGGSGFKTSEKIRSCAGAHTLVINGVECEPGITIDQSVLLHESNYVRSGTEASAKAIGARKIIIATKDRGGQIATLKKLYPAYDIIPFPDRYPAGAEKLILKKLTGKMPPPRIRPYQLGYLMQNAVSLRAIGRALIDGVPVAERPLTLAMPTTGFYKNTIVPIGLPIRQILEIFSLPYNPEVHLISTSGIMMGREATPDDLIEKTTLSILILSRGDTIREERPCIRCGACNSACPLSLHPFTLTERIRQDKTTAVAFKMQMSECFLCGVCSAVCPSDIPLVQRLKKGKKCL